MVKGLGRLKFYAGSEHIVAKNRLLTIATKWMQSRLRRDADIPGANTERMRDRLRTSIYFRSTQFKERTRYEADIRFQLDMENPHELVLHSWWGD